VSAVRRGDAPYVHSYVGDVNAVDRFGVTALANALELPLPRCLAMLAALSEKAGFAADVAMGRRRHTACIRAACRSDGAAEVLRWLVRHAAVDVNAADVAGHTALHHALQAGNVDAARYLLSLPDVSVDDGVRTLAAERGDEAVLKAIVSVLAARHCR
jgi:hypothetical protein